MNRLRRGLGHHPGVLRNQPLDILAGHPANRTEQGASAHGRSFFTLKRDEIRMNHHRDHLHRSAMTPANAPMIWP